MKLVTVCVYVFYGWSSRLRVGAIQDLGGGGEGYE